MARGEDGASRPLHHLEEEPLHDIEDREKDQS